MGQGNGNTSNSKQMPVGNNVSYGNATGKPESQGKIIYGTDLRSGQGK